MPKGKPIPTELKRMVVNNTYSVSKIILRYNARGHVEKLPKSGRPRKTTFLMARRIKRISQRDTWLSGPRIIAEIQELQVSARTV